jgi:hypothetical protein
MGMGTSRETHRIKWIAYRFYVIGKVLFFEICLSESRQFGQEPWLKGGSGKFGITGDGVTASTGYTSLKARNLPLFAPDRFPHLWKSHSKVVLTGLDLIQLVPGTC